MTLRIKLVDVRDSLAYKENVFCPASRRKSQNPPPELPLLQRPPAMLNVTDDDITIIATNGPLPSAPNRGASPASQSPPVPNGKPTSPYNEQRNPMSPMSPNAQIAAQTVSSKDPKAAAQAASDMRNVVRRKLTGYVGFANLPNQWHRKSVRKGFNFNVMVVGKSTLSHMNLSMIFAELDR